MCCRCAHVLSVCLECHLSGGRDVSKQAEVNTEESWPQRKVRFLVIVPYSRPIVTKTTHTGAGVLATGVTGRGGGQGWLKSHDAPGSEGNPGPRLGRRVSDALSYLADG